jgi:hypothetical protein
LSLDSKTMLCHAPILPSSCSSVRTRRCTGHTDLAVFGRIWLGSASLAVIFLKTLSSVKPAVNPNSKVKMKTKKFGGLGTSCATK